MINMNEVITNVTLSEFRTISPDEDAKKEGTKKTVHLKIKYDGLMLKDVFSKAFKSDVVAWQNGASGRKNFDNIKDKQIIEVSAKAPGAGPQADPETAMVAKLQSMTPTEQAAYLKELMSKAAKA